jgi:hypothetical protein
MTFLVLHRHLIVSLDIRHEHNKISNSHQQQQVELCYMSLCSCKKSSHCLQYTVAGHAFHRWLLNSGGIPLVIEIIRGRQPFFLGCRELNKKWGRHRSAFAARPTGPRQCDYWVFILKKRGGWGFPLPPYFKALVKRATTRHTDGHDGNNRVLGYLSRSIIKSSTQSIILFY